MHAVILHKLLKAVLLYQLQKVLCEVYRSAWHTELCELSSPLLECYFVDKKVLQYMLRDILSSGDYTLEGIAQYTRIPFDVILDAASGHHADLSITPWVRIVDLFIRVKPELAGLLQTKLLELVAKQQSTHDISMLLNEP